MSVYEGRLELTWTNKPLRLLAHEDGSYEWMPPSDRRVAEVRLLHDAGAVGKVHSDLDRAKDNLLIRGDALNALTSLIELPEFAREYVGKVKLAYLDPPFNTQQSFLHYDDALEHSVWLTMMRDRLAQVKTLLSPDGSVWVHCDDSERDYLKVMMDEVFGRDCFVAAIVWQKRYSRSSDAIFSSSHDYLIVYSRSEPNAWAKVRNLLPVSEKQATAYSNPDNDPRGPWQSVNFAVPEVRRGLDYPIETPSGKVVVPPSGKHWRVREERFRALLAEDRIYFGSGSSLPRVKVFLSESRGLTPNTLWLHEEVGHNDEATKHLISIFPEVQPFATPKPERLLHRIVHIASDPGDIVLDCFLGSGTTAAVAHKMGRRWVGVEVLGETVDTYAKPRLTKVVDGTDPGGITGEVAWQAGGGFRTLDVAPSMFDAVDGQVFLSEWVTNGKLAEVTAAQLHYDYEYTPPFAGRRGRSRLAVIDGLVNEAVVRLIVNALPGNERVVICGTAIDPEAKETLRTLRAGSTVRKIPSSILQEYRQAARWTQSPLFADAGEGDRVSEEEAAHA